MKPQYDNQLITSFCLYLDYVVVTEGEGYKNHSSPFFVQTDRNFSGANIYASPFRSWVFDQSASGAQMPIISGSNGVVSGDADFMRGRFYTTGAVNAPSGSYAVKEFNIIYTTDNIEKLIYQNKYVFQPKTSQTLSGISPDGIIAPCIFVTNDKSVNTPFALGGEDLTENFLRLVVVGENKAQLDAINSLIRDKKNTVFPLIATNQMPINESGCLKSGVYNYDNYRYSATSDDLVFVDDVNIYSFSEKSELNTSLELRFSFIDITVKKNRFPRGNSC